MARIQGVQKSQAGPMVKLVYRLGPRMMRKLTGREASIGSGMEPIEIWAHKPKRRLHGRRDTAPSYSGRSLHRLQRTPQRLDGSGALASRQQGRDRLHQPHHSEESTLCDVMNDRLVLVRLEGVVRSRFHQI